MFCVFPQGWITSSWCDGPVSTSTGQNRLRDCTHHAKLRMTQFLLQPEISHCYFVSWIKSMTCERQRPCRVYWDLCTICPWLFNHAKRIIMISRVKGSFNYLFANTSELWPPCMLRDHTWMFEQVLVCRYMRNSAWKDPVHADEHTNRPFTCASAGVFQICMIVKEELIQIPILKKMNGIMQIMSGWYKCLDVINNIFFKGHTFMKTASLALSITTISHMSIYNTFALKFETGNDLIKRSPEDPRGRVKIRWKSPQISDHVTF